MTRVGDAAPGIEAASQLFWVALYLMDRCFGGPEDGGWWFDQAALVTDTTLYTELQGAPAAFVSFDAAHAYAEQLRTHLAPLNHGRRPLWSVLSEGIYEVLVVEADMLPGRYPEQRPTYE